MRLTRLAAIALAIAIPAGGARSDLGQVSRRENLISVSGVVVSASKRIQFPGMPTVR